MKKNILLLLLDGCRAQSLGCYGYDVRETSPNIDALAKTGVVARRNYATSFCTMPSVVSMMTGLYPCVHKATATWGYYDGAYPFLTDILRENDYQTFGISNAIAAMSAEWGFIRGYDRYYRIGKEENWFKASKEEQRGVRKAAPGVSLKRKLYRSAKKISPGRAEAMRRKAQISHYSKNDMGGKKALEAFRMELGQLERDRPFFGYVNIPETHHPFMTVKPFSETWGKLDVTENLLKLNFNPDEFYQEDLDLTESEKTTFQLLYDSCVRYSDHLVGEIVECLKEAGLFENSVVVLLGDHGGMVFEKMQFCGASCFTYEPEIRVPFIVANLGGDTVVSDLTSVVDVFPTLLEVAGLEDIPSHGKSILGSGAGHDEIATDYPSYPTWLMEMLMSDPAVLVKFGRTNRTLVKNDGGKLIWTSNGRHERYDLTRDPGEESDSFVGSDSDFALIERMKDFYEDLVGQAGRNLEYYPHNDIGRDGSLLPPISEINPGFDHGCIKTLA